MNKKITLMVASIATAMTVCAQTPDTTRTEPYPYNTFDTYRIGGYGEILGKFMDYGTNRYGSPSGSTDKSRSTVAIPRFVIAFDYKLAPKWILGAEIEFESGGTGAEYELESGTGSENGEYEVEYEKGGEVAIEQFHITRLIHPAFNVRAGHMIVPVGLTNTHHEPVNYFGTSRPEGESTMLPCTWHETGIELFGTFGRGYGKFSYEAMVVAGLNANGFDIYNWVQGGRQGFFEADNFTSPGWVARLNWTGVPGLRLGGSVYYCADAGANSDKPSYYSTIGDIDVLLYSFDAQYINKYVTARANFLTGNIGNTAALTKLNKSLSNNSPYSRKGPIAKRSLTYSAEIGANLRNIIGSPKCPVIYPFVHYEYYNTQEEGESTQVMDDRCQVSKWEFGANWKPSSNIVVKANYITRQIGTNKPFGTNSDYNSENEFAVSVAFTGWFSSK